MRDILMNIKNRDSAPTTLSRRGLGVAAIGAGLYSVLPSEVAGAGRAKVPAGRNAALFRQMIERGFLKGDMTVTDELCAERIAEHQYMLPTTGSGPANMKADILQTRQAVENLGITIEDMVEDGDKLWIRTRVTGIERKTGKSFVMDCFDICRFENGKIVEHWGVPDRFAMMQQVGLVPNS